MINLTFLALCLWALWIWEGETSSRVSSSVKDSHGSICRFLSENVVIVFSVHLPVTLMLMCQLTRSLVGCPHLGITSSMLTLLKRLHGKMSLGPAVPSNVHCGRGKAAASPNFLARWKGVPSCSQELAHAETITRGSSVGSFRECCFSEFVCKGQTPYRAQTLTAQTSQVFHL